MHAELPFGAGIFYHTVFFFTTKRHLFDRIVFFLGGTIIPR